MRSAEQSYESLRERHRARLLEVLGPALERTDWSRARLREWRQQNLRALLRHAVERSPWHRERLSGLDPDRATEADLQRIEPMDKAALMANWDAIVTDPRLSLASCQAHLDRLSQSGQPAYLEDEFHVVASGGSSGTRGVFVYGWDEWAAFFASMTRWFARELARRGLTLDPEVRAASVGSHSPTHATAAVAYAFADGTTRLPVSLPLAQIVESLNRSEPEVLFCYASALGLLAAEAEAGRLRIRPQWIWASSEPLLPEVARAVERVWGSPAVNAYGTSDVGMVANGCGAGPGMHLSDDELIVELVDRAGRPVGPTGRAEKLYATPLFGRTLPLIRYEITDEVTLVEKACPCGSRFRRIEDVQGRLDDCFRYASGIVIHPHVFRSPLSRAAEVLEYQVCQTECGAEVRLRTSGPIELAQLRQQLEAELRGVGLVNAEVELLPVDSIERVGIGKLKRFVPLPA